MQQRRSYTVEWRFISLKVLNEQQTADWYTPAYRRGHMAGHECLRVADAVRLAEGNDAVARLYTALGTMIHNGQRGDELRNDTVAFIAEALVSAGLDAGYGAAAVDEAHDGYIRAETALALLRAGNDVGTPIITFHPGAADENSLFGPVIASIPRGDAAVKLWDAIELIATTSGMAELKRSLRAKPVFD
ncbi:MAG: hypothetical protein WD023_10870 [Ilumatobacteraceae bacterium]